MKREFIAWQLIYKSLQQHIPVMLLYVLESKGSSPGRQGFVMAVTINGEMQGSIGGGIMEHKFVEMAKEILQYASHRAQEASIRKQIHDKSVAKNQSGMICSGEQTILLYPVSTSDEDHVKRILSCLQQNKNATLKLSPTGIEFFPSIPENDFYFSMQSEAHWQYHEKIGYKNQLFIIGGGHCALAFSKLMSGMDFYIRVYDERKNLKTMLENESAHEKHVINDYSELNTAIPGGDNHYLVIMTFGYRTDDMALRAMVNKNFKYLGLLGSKSKIKKMFADYRKEGIEETFLQKVHSPIGLQIKSETPEEIAVSIAAEIIKVKNQV